MQLVGKKISSPKLISYPISAICWYHRPLVLVDFRPHMVAVSYSFQSLAYPLFPFCPAIDFFIDQIKNQLGENPSFRHKKFVFVFQK